MLDIGLIDVFAEGNEQASFPRLRFAEHRHSERINAFHGGQRAIRRFWRQLAAVRAIGLVAIVFLGVVARGDHHARRRVQIADGEAHHRRGAQRIEQIDLHARSRVNQSGFHGELPRADA